jgi:hypothetical protein
MTDIVPFAAATSDTAIQTPAACRAGCTFQ